MPSSACMISCFLTVFGSLDQMSHPVELFDGRTAAEHRLLSIDAPGVMTQHTRVVDVQPFDGMLPVSFAVVTGNECRPSPADLRVRGPRANLDQIATRIALLHHAPRDASYRSRMRTTIFRRSASG